MNKGTVKWYDATKGYGFIEGEDGKDIFVHRSGLKNPSVMLDEGLSVEFEIKSGDKGPVAIDVDVI